MDREEHLRGDRIAFLAALSRISNREDLVTAMFLLVVVEHMKKLSEIWQEIIQL